MSSQMLVNWREIDNTPAGTVAMLVLADMLVKSLSIVARENGEYALSERWSAVDRRYREVILQCMLELWGGPR